MRAKGFLPLFPLIITALTGCDNVGFGGIEVELRPPPSIELAPPPEEVVELPAAGGPEPLPLGPILYLVERVSSGRGTILPIAEMTPSGGYRALPTFAEVPDLLERFPVERWATGREFTLLMQGERVGTFLLGGTTQEDRSTCLARPRGTGTLELRPEVAGAQRFLALAAHEGAAAAALPTSSFQWVGGEDAALQAGALNITQRLLQQLGVPWPPSLPDARRDLQSLVLDGSGTRGLATSVLFGNDLAIRAAPSQGYSLFILARERAGTELYDPVLTWYQRVGADGKAAARLVGAHHDLRTAGAGGADLLLELFGTDRRWFGIVGPNPAGSGSWELLYQDECGLQPPRGAIRTFP